MFRSKKSALEKGRDSVAQAAVEARSKGRKGADKAGEKVKDFDAAKTAEAAATVLTDLKNKAASTLEKAGVATAVGTAATKAATAAESADLSGKAAAAGERTASTAMSIRDWIAEMVSSLASKSGDLADQAPEAADDARSRAAGVLESLLGSLQHKASEAQDKAAEIGDKGPGIRLDPETIAQFGRVLIMIGTALSGLFGPRSGDVVKGLRETAQEAGEASKERADDLASLGKDLLGTFADALIAAIQRGEERAKQAIDQGRDQVVGVADTVTQTANVALRSTQETAEEAAPAADIEVEVETKKEGGHFFRWLFLGLLVGGGYAYYKSRNGGDDGWESVASDGSPHVSGSESTSYWPAGSATPVQPAESGAPSATAMEDTPAES